jgi:signal transduction histidine kinase
MKSLGKLILVIVLNVLCGKTTGQQLEKHGHSNLRIQDTSEINKLNEEAWIIFFRNPDSSLALGLHALQQSRELKFSAGEINALQVMGESLRWLGEFPQALEIQFKALQLSRKEGDRYEEACTLSYIGFIYTELKEFRQALDFLLKSKELFEIISNSESVMKNFNLSNIGNAYEGMNMLDSALVFQKEAEKKSMQLESENLKVLILTRLGIVYARLGKIDQALKFYYHAHEYAKLIGDDVTICTIENQLAQIFNTQKNIDSSLYYAQLALKNSKISMQKLQILNAANLLVKLYRKKNIPDSIIYYQDITIAMNDSLYGPAKFRELQLLTLKEQQRQQEAAQQQERYKNKTRTIALLASLGVFIFVVIILYRNIRQKQKAKDKIEKAYTQLKTAQAQLIQQEKMAALGELTAGIAHEIQNPLNFVNNFSEVSNELIDEMKSELKKGNSEEAINIADNVKQNLEKINHHGKRADAIVKGMLQHSRSTSGVKEPTDINALCDEYLRLAYHGLRAKDKSFNANFETHFDNSVGKINIIPQDIGRVILNLINNAFYAVNEKEKAPQPPKGVNYGPTVIVSTKKINSPLGAGGIEIKVKDNGNGIPQKVLDKIFQPFFTTKPTGQGTGLGLSLAYDIVTKGHGGELKVETKEGEGSTFIVLLPGGQTS